MTADDATLGREPTEIPPADLASVFTSSPRAQGLGGLLRTQPAASPTPAPAPEHPDRGPTREQSPAGRRSDAEPVARARPRRSRSTAAGSRQRRGTSGDAASDTTGDRLEQVVAYIPVSLKARLQQAATGAESYTTLTMAAIDAHHAELAGKWAKARPTGSAFVGWQRGRRRNEEPMVSMTIRLVPADEATLDRFWSEAGAPNRSAYIEAALDLFLPNQ